MSLLAYIDAWRREDPELIAGLVAPDCVVIECNGPVYRGRATVRRWATDWFAAGGRIHGWEVVTHRVCGDLEVAEWRFDCTWKDGRGQFDGCSLATSESGTVSVLREYHTSAPLYDWNGTWR